jgi:hypothetical protein
VFPINKVLTPLAAPARRLVMLSRRQGLASGLCRSSPPSSPLRPGHHHVEVAVAALRANQSPTPFRYWCVRPIPACLLGRVRLAPVTTCFAPDHKTELRCGGAFERHRRAAVGLHECEADSQPLASLFGYPSRCSISGIKRSASHGTQKICFKTKWYVLA